MQKYRALVVFWIAVAVSLASLLLDPLIESPFPLLLVFSVLFNIFVLYQNDRGQLVKAKEMRRAHEPPRELSGLQVVLLILIVMSQTGLTTYLLLFDSG